MWIQPVDTLDLVVKGLIVGVVASAPMGPVGVLVVQRTLNKGRWFGFVTGLGAAVSDLIYALVAGMGMSFVMDFVSNPRTMQWLQLGGAVLMFLFGVYTYRSNPMEKMRPPSQRRGTFLHNAFTGLALTLGNPLIVFLFMALFARFAFVVPDHPVEQTVGYISVFAGAILWWYGLVCGIDRVRTRFHVRGIVWLNRTIGVVVMVVSLLGIYLTLRGRLMY